MKETKNILIFLFVGMVVASCGLGDRRITRVETQHPGWDQATVKAVAERKGAARYDESNGDGVSRKSRFINQEGSEEKWTYGINRERDMGAIVRKPVFWVYFKDGKVLKTKGDWGKLGYKIFRVVIRINYS